jgi:hypothetical protein
MLALQSNIPNNDIIATYVYAGAMSSSAPESDSAILLEDIFSKPSFPRNITHH